MSSWRKKWIDETDRNDQLTFCLKYSRCKYLFVCAKVLCCIFYCWFLCSLIHHKKIIASYIRIVFILFYFLHSFAVDVVGLCFYFISFSSFIFHFHLSSYLWIVLLMFCVNFLLQKSNMFRYNLLGFCILHCRFVFLRCRTCASLLLLWSQDFWDITWCQEATMMILSQSFEVYYISSTKLSRTCFLSRSVEKMVTSKTRLNFFSILFQYLPLFDKMYVCMMKRLSSYSVFHFLSFFRQFFFHFILKFILNICNFSCFAMINTFIASYLPCSRHVAALCAFFCLFLILYRLCLCFSVPYFVSSPHKYLSFLLFSFCCSISTCSIFSHFFLFACVSAVVHVILSYHHRRNEVIFAQYFSQNVIPSNSLFHSFSS